MTTDALLEVSARGIQTALMVSAPVLLLALAAGLTVSIFQAATQINDAALAFIPKILATVLALLLFGGWMMSEMASYSIYAYNQIPTVGK